MHPGCEADSSPQHSAQAENILSCTSTSSHILNALCNKNKDNLSFDFCIILIVYYSPLNFILQPFSFSLT